MNDVTDHPEKYGLASYQIARATGSDFQVDPITESTTLDGSYSGRLIPVNSSSGVTLTLPSTLDLGFNCAICQIGNGQVTVAAASGASLESRQSFTKTAGKWGVIYISCVEAGVFVLSGDGA